MMKKRLFALFLLAAVCLCGTVSAETADENAYDRPIFFRGIEWGSSYGTIMENYPEKESSAWEPKGFGAMFFEEEAGHYGEIGFTQNTRIPDGETVGGYNPNTVRLYFVYTAGEDGLLAKDHDHAALCCAEYELDFRSQKEDFDAALEDLTNKLTMLYGEVDSKPTTGYGTRAVWKGADGTLVSLFTRRGSYLNGGNYYELYIRYASEKVMASLLQDAKTALDREFSTITDGL